MVFANQIYVFHENPDFCLVNSFHGVHGIHRFHEIHGDRGIHGIHGI